jgi:hypothetical protein
MTAEVGSSRHGRGYWAALVVGGFVMAIAVGGAFNALSLSSFGSWGTWIIGADLVNDFLVLPVVAVVGVALAKVPLGRYRAPVQAGLFASVMVLVVAYPGITEKAASDNPTIQPLNYATATLTVLAVVWAAMALWSLLRRRPR